MFGKFYFWQPAPNEHEAGWIRGIAELGFSVTVFYQNDIPEWRKVLGLGGVDYGKATVRQVDAQHLEGVIDEVSTQYDFHFFTGIKEFSLNGLAFDQLFNSNSKLFYISESKDPRGAKGVLRYIRDIILDSRRRKRVDAVLAMGELGTEWFKRIGFDGGKVFEFGYAVVDQISKAIVPLTRLDSFRIVYVGQLIGRKRVDSLIRAVAQLKPIYRRGIVLEVIGSGKDKLRLKRLVEYLGISGSVNFHGALPNSEVRTLVSESDLLILPSAWDGWGAVTNEALLAGCRVGVSDMCGSSSLARGQANCFVFPVGDVSLIADELTNQMLLGKVTSQERRQRIDIVRSLIGESAISYYLLEIVKYTLAPMQRKPRAPWAARERVAVSYHFFPHYRSAVLSELQLRTDCSFRFAADKDGSRIDPSIKAWLPLESGNFDLLPIARLYKGVYCQPKMLSWALSLSDDCVVFLGDPNNLSVWLSALVLRMRGKRVLFWAHGWIDAAESGIKKFFRKIFFSIPNGMMLYGRRAKNIAIHHGFRPDNTWVIYNSLDYARQKFVREQISCEDRRRTKLSLFGRSDLPVVACITRLTPVRRLDILVNALAVLKARGHECLLMLIGDGPEKDRLLTQARSAGVVLKCAGALYDEAEIGPLLSTAVVTVAPGKVGLTAMHSLAYGIPVLTHGDFDNQMPECEAIVPDFTGDFFERDDVNSLVALLLKWTQSENVSLIVQQHCINVIEKFYNPATQAKIIEDAVFDVKPEAFDFNSIQPLEISNCR